MTMIVKIDTETMSKLEEVVKKVDIANNKQLIAEIFVYAYGYDNVKNTGFEDWNLDEAILTIKKQGIILSEHLAILDLNLVNDVKMQGYLATRSIEKLVEEIERS
ncbi:hypothetical protein [Streptococcus infantarius]|uniref:hypothetical protein n=1 Tax=Streptococcus infantarius TaxID=102684 RepID=UPI0022E5EA2E|nr:hypothetical protein [Streptococcus infantarius]